MRERPYFRYSGKELEELFESSKEDCAVLENLKVELSHRKRTKSRLLEEKINKTLTEIYSKQIESTSNTQLGYSTDNTILSNQGTETATSTTQPIYAEPLIPKLNSTPTPEKYVVECAKCQTPNFIYALDDKTQYLSCSNCRTPFEASLKQGVLRTTFNSEPATSSSSKPSNNMITYVLIAFIILFAIYLIN